MRIEYEVINLSNQKPKEVIDSYVELFENHLHLVLDFHADEPIDPDDKMIGWEPVYNYYSIVAMKKNIAGVELSWVHKSSKYGVYINVNGFSNDLKLYFKSKVLAQQMRNAIYEWLTK